jgi:hypothetical protein
MGKDFASRVKGDILIDDALDGAFFEITSQDGSKADRFSLNRTFFITALATCGAPP